MKNAINLVLLLALLMTVALNLSACNGADPTDIAKAYCEGITTANFNLLNECCHPSVYMEMRDGMLLAYQESYPPSQYGYKFSITEIGECTSLQLSNLEHSYRKDLNIDVSMEAGYLYKYIWTAYDDEGSASESVDIICVAKVGAHWYAFPTPSGFYE